MTAARTALLDQMARLLAESGVDLADDVACMIVLSRARFRSAEILDHMHAAMKVAKDKRHARPLKAFVGGLLGRRI